LKDVRGGSLEQIDLGLGQVEQSRRLGEQEVCSEEVEQ
jgi:hypothetical protein